MRKDNLSLYIFFNYCNMVVNSALLDSLLGTTNIRLSTPDLIARDGYHAENHAIETDDGYILNIQRIRRSLRSIPILINHGLCSDSHVWMLSGKNHSLPYVLANEGFDVWLGNVRGNSYGKTHIKFSSKDSRFWKFSIDEIGMYDLPGMISYIHKLTHQKVVNIGYSLTATAGLIMNMKRHDMDGKVRLMVHLGPPIFMDTARVSTNRLVKLFNRAKPLLDFLKINEWPPGDPITKFWITNGCRLTNIATKICEEMILYLFNSDRTHVSHYTLQELMNYMPDSTSTMVIDHLAQWTVYGHFRPYDYGMMKNLIKYKRITPLDYDLSDVVVPTTIFYSDYDEYVSPEAISRLHHSLSNRVRLFKVNKDRFSHLHFAFATNARDLVYKKIIRIIATFY